MNLFEIYRVKDWYYYLGFILIGFFLTSSFYSRLLIFLLFGSFLLAYAFSFNDFWDEGKKAYFLFPLLLSILLFISLNIMQIVLASIFLFIVTVYSAKPLRLKSKPFFSSLCNGIGFSLLFLIGYCVINLDLNGIIFFFFFLCFNMVSQFIHEAVDIDKDREKRILTTGVLLGKRKLKKLCYVFLWLSFFTCLYLFYIKIVNFLFLFTTIFFVIFFTNKLIKCKIDRNLRKNYKTFGIFAGFIYFFSIILI